MCEDYYRGLYDACESMAAELCVRGQFFEIDTNDSSVTCVIGLVGDFHDEIANAAKAKFHGALRVVRCGRSIVFEHDDKPDYHCGQCGDECECTAPELPGDYLEQLEIAFYRLRDIQVEPVNEGVC